MKRFGRKLRMATALLMVVMMCFSVLSPFGLNALAGIAETAESESPPVSCYVVLADAGGGTIAFFGEDISVRELAYEEGEIVLLTVAPDEGSSLERLTVLDGEGEELEWEASEGGEDLFTFTMAASDVTVSADFAAEKETAAEETASGSDTGETAVEESGAEGTVSDPDIEKETPEESYGEETSEGGTEEISEEAGGEISGGETGEKSEEETGETSEEETEEISEEETTEAELVETVEADGDAVSDPVLEEYIRSNASSKYIPSVKSVDLVNVMLVKNTFFDGTVMKSSDTLDSIMDGIEDGDCDEAAKFIAQILTYVGVYDLNEDSVYFVACVDTMHDNKYTSVREAVFAYANDYGELLGGCVYDQSTGLAYIPKACFLTGDGTAYEYACTQVQLMQVLGRGLDGTADTVSCSVTDVDGGTTDIYRQAADMFLPGTTSVRTKTGLSDDEITVYANGLPMEDGYEYNAETGEVSFSTLSPMLGSVSVEVDEKGLLEKAVGAAASLFSSLKSSVLSEITAYAKTITWDGNTFKSAGTVVLPSEAEAGDLLTGTAWVKFTSGQLNTGSNWNGAYYFTNLESGSVQANLEATYWAIAKNSYYNKYKDSLTSDNLVTLKNATSAYEGQLNFQANFNSKKILSLGYTHDFTEYKNESYSVDFSGLGTLYLACAHVGEGNVKDATDSDEDASGWTDATMYARILAIDADTGAAVIGVTSSAFQAPTTLQSGTGIFVVDAEIEEVVISLTKETDTTGLSDEVLALVEGDNQFYSLDGARYSFYEDPDDAIAAWGGGTASENRAFYFVTNDDGVGSLHGDDPEKGTTYYMVETSAAVGHDKDRTGGMVTVNGSAAKEYDAANYPGIYGITIDSDGSEIAIVARDPMVLGSLEIQKVVAGDGGDTSVDCSGVLFRIRYYATTDVSDAEGAADMGWTVFTDSDGVARLDADHLAYANNSDLLLDSDGNSVLPLGYYRIIELSASYSGKWNYADAGKYISNSDGTEHDLNTALTIDDMYWTVTATDGTGIVVTADESGDATGTRSGSLLLRFVSKKDGSGEAKARLYVVGEDGSYTYSNVDAATVTANDYSLPGDLAIEKFDAYNKEHLAGAVFRLLDSGGNAITTVDGATGDIDSDGYITVQSDGYAHVYGIPAGDYTLEEVEVPKGYKQADDSSLTITPGEMYEAEVPDYPILAGVRIRKYTEETGRAEPQGDAQFAGGTFDVITLQDCTIMTTEYSVGDVVVTLTLDENGCAESGTDALALGSYKIVETGAPTGYLTGGEVTFTITESDDGTLKDLTQGEIDDPTIHGGVIINKTDIETEDADTPQGDASYSGAEFIITNKSANAVRVNGRMYEPDEDILTLTTDSSGEASVAGNVLPYGSYTITEVKAPTGYLNTGVISRNFSIRTDGEVVDLRETPIENNPVRGGISIDKSDYERLINQEDVSSTQGDATLKGAIFSVTNMSGNAVMVNGELFANGSVVALLVTDEEGDVTTASDLLPYGTYYVTETEAPTGYLKNTTVWKIQIREDGKVYDLGTESAVVTAGTFEEVTDQVIRGGVQVVKADLQSLYAVAEGAAVLDDGEFTITNKSETDVLVDGVWYAPGEVVYTLTGADYNEDLTAYVTASDLLPYGTYTVTETKAPTGYLSSAESARGVYTFTFDIRGDGVIVSKDTVDSDIVVTDQVKRGDFALRKIDSDTQKTMAGVSFRITSVTTGESYIITTDANGYYSSSADWNFHSTDTNGGTAESGLWFTGYSAEDDPEAYAAVMEGVDDTLGALPYDTYIIEEIAAESNEDYILYSDTFTIYRDSCEILLGNIENKKFSLGTSAEDDGTGTRYAIAEEGTVLIDTVTYANLEGGSYILRGFLMDRDALTVLTDADGKEIMAEKAFSLTASGSGSVKMEFAFDASNLAGVNAVVYEYLFQISEDGSETQIGSHADPEDEEQSIYFGGIGTTALDSETGDHVSCADTEITLIDTIEYTNLPADRKFTVTGTLMLKSSGEEYLDDDGNTVTATASFTTSSTGSGTVELTFTFSGVNLAGDAVVVFEEVSRSNVVYAVHADIDDEDQTVEFPKIRTTATDDVTDAHVGAADETVTIVDTVAYEGLTAGKDYTMTGTLYDRTSGEALTDEDGNVFTASVDFTAAEEGSGSVELTFTVPGSAVAGKAVVAFESVDYEGIEIAVHADIDDEDQTVWYPEIGTTAADSETGLHEGDASAEIVTIVDVVSYTGLLPGSLHTMSGVLMDRATGEALTDGDGNTYTAEVEFTASETGSGSVELEFTVPGTVVSGRTLVVFEALTYEGIQVAAHADIDDEGQTVTYPRIGTSAKDADDGDSAVIADGTVSITDIVTYTGLIPGGSYRLSGVLMDQKTGEEITVSGNSVTADTDFTASETGSGTVKVVFTFDASGLTDDLVVFETLYSVDTETGEETRVAIHQDITDEAQTIAVTIPDTPETTAADETTTETKKSAPKTGVPDLLWPAVILAVLCGGVGIACRRRRR